MSAHLATGLASGGLALHRLLLLLRLCRRPHRRLVWGLDPAQWHTALIARKWCVIACKGGKIRGVKPTTEQVEVTPVLRNAVWCGCQDHFGEAYGFARCCSKDHRPSPMLHVGMHSAFSNCCCSESHAQALHQETQNATRARLHRTMAAGAQDTAAQPNDAQGRIADVTPQLVQCIPELCVFYQT